MPASSGNSIIAIVREVSESIASCELTHLQRERIDVPCARKQHEAYCAMLRRLGCEVVCLPEEPDLPDAVFVEDTAVVFDELAVITIPGAPSRRRETATVARALAPFRELAHLREPATLDGGDVLVVGKTVLVGLSSRTDEEGARQLARIVGPHDYSVHGIEVRGCLHLRTALSRVAEDVLLLQPDWIDRSELERLLPHCGFLDVDPSEPFGANALLVGETVVLPEAYPRTRRRLEANGLAVEAVPADELAKAEGGLTCSSLLIRAHPAILR